MKSVSSQRQACPAGGPTIPSWSATFVKRRNAVAASTCNQGCPICCIRFASHLHASTCRSTGLLHSAPVKPNGKLSQRKSSRGRDAVSGNCFGTEPRLLASALSIRTWRQRSFWVGGSIRGCCTVTWSKSWTMKPSVKMVPFLFTMFPNRNCSLRTDRQASRLQQQQTEHCTEARQKGQIPHLCPCERHPLGPHQLHPLSSQNPCT